MHYGVDVYDIGAVAAYDVGVVELGFDALEAYARHLFS